MVFSPFWAALALGLALVVILVAAFGWGRRESGIAWSFVAFTFAILLLALWATGVWVEPVGPVYWGVAWIPFLFVGLLVLLLLLAAVPRPRGRPPERPERPVNAEEARTTEESWAITGLLWLVLLLLVIAVAAAYV